MAFLSFHSRQLSLPLNVEIWLDTAGYIERQAGCFVSARLLFLLLLLLLYTSVMPNVHPASPDTRYTQPTLPILYNGNPLDSLVYTYCEPICNGCGKKLPSGKVGFVRRPIKIKPTKSILADAFLPNRDGSAWSFPYSYNLDAPLPIETGPKETHQPIALTDGPAQTYNHGREYQNKLATGRYDPVPSNLYHRDAALPPPAPSPILEPQSPTYSRAHAAPATETRHRCAVCGRYRSPSYQHRHPIIPGQIPPTSVCRKCRFTYTSSGDSTESDESDRRSRGRRRSRKRRSRSRPIFDKEPSAQPAPIPQILQAPAPQTSQPQEPPTPAPPPPPPPPPPQPQPQPLATKVESSPPIFHFCPNPPGLFLTAVLSRATTRSPTIETHAALVTIRCTAGVITIKTATMAIAATENPGSIPPESPGASMTFREPSPLRQAERPVVKDANSWSMPATGNWDDSNERVRKPRPPTPSPSPVRERRYVEPHQLSSSLRGTRPPQAKICRFASDEPQNQPNVQYQTWEVDRPKRQYSRVISRGDDNNNEESGWYDTPDYERPISTRPSRNVSMPRRPSRVETDRPPSEILIVPKPRRQFEVRYGTYQPEQQRDYEYREPRSETRFKHYEPSNPRRVTTVNRRSYAYPVVRDEQEEEDTGQGYSDPRYEKWNKSRYASHEIIEGPRGTYNPPATRDPSGQQYKARERSVVW
ncbi:hypothetical protein TRV_01048 [Trichophyton verrucosum HKI 0517]|uniref:Uncharacterized protein n=1 Tax=Trichophyton verrucosum (strain HKI 0517) TaxID=663202 RepID=D4D1U6_TRIVH|nr:uncharacterized protein TRV_01048 [Trichophyton verrucosum HKI 0517]EFE44155.1 hypothetical protein TRV_01048 [Trichophyton verrucosum HKI 0517]